MTGGSEAVSVSPAPRPTQRLGPPIAVQIIALLVVVLLVGQLATLAVVVLFPPPRPPVYRVDEIAAALKSGDAAPRYAPMLVRSFTSEAPKERSPNDPRVIGLKTDLARAIGVDVNQVRLSVEPPHGAFWFDSPRYHDHGARREAALLPPPQTDDGPPPMGVDQPPPWAHGGPHLAPPERMGVVIGEMDAAYQVQPGRWAQVRSPPQAFPNAWQRRMLLWFLACLLVLTPAGYLFARRLTAPIRRFASAADRLGRDPRGAPITLSGPAEIGVAAAAFNDMQARLARYVGDRTAMIAAIAHDLRTPLARVQFKLQRAPEDLAADIRSDLGQMEAMIAAVLAFVRDAAQVQERGPLDLTSLLEVVADDAAATGADVELEPGPAFVVEGGASALQRLFVNLVDNAVKYGGSAQIAIARDAGDVVVRVSDAGPGIATEEQERVFEPFYRVETSRSRETGGIGLGLSVARTIARAHGGDVTLDSNGVGLTAVVRLPGAPTAR